MQIPLGRLWLPIVLLQSALAQTTEDPKLLARLAAQQQQIDELRAAVAEQRALLIAQGQMLQRALHVEAPSVPTPVQRETKPQIRQPAIESPLTLHLGGVDVTPGGFLDLTAIRRSADVMSGTSTNFAGIPYGNTPAGRLPEFRFSALSSRLTLRAETRLAGTVIKGYMESDFLGNPPANVSISNNGSSLRLRLAWVNFARGRWEVLAGQAYSFLTPNRTGIYAAPTEVFTTRVSDPNLHVGVTSSRAPQARVVYHATKSLALGVALENPEQFIGSGVALPTALAASYATELNSGNLANPFGAPNLHPDVIPKITFDSRIGSHALHLESVGLFRSFHTYNVAANQSFTAHGFGGSINGNVAVTKRLTYFLNTFASDGGGRYEYGLGPDLIVRPNGSPSPIKTGTVLTGFEFRPLNNLELYGYYGGAYYERNFALDSKGVFTGFGFAGSPNSANRTVQEASIGSLRTIWKDPLHGAVQINSVFSYLTRSPWYVGPAQPRSAHLGQIYIDMRYVLP